jgi:hypothetical protein
MRKKLSYKNWIKLYSTFLVKTRNYKYKFYDISKFLTGMAEREYGRKFCHSLPVNVVKKIIETAGGRSKKINSVRYIEKNGYRTRKIKSNVFFWNVKPAFELPPADLKPAKPYSMRDARIAFKYRPRNPEKDKLALELFQKLTGNNGE